MIAIALMTAPHAGSANRTARASASARARVRMGFMFLSFERRFNALEKMLEGELEAVLFQRLEVTQLITAFAFHFCLRERRLS